MTGRFRRWSLMAVACAALLAIPGVALAQSKDPAEGVLVRVNGDVFFAADEEASIVVVVRGDLTMEGTAETVIVVDGSAELSGATVENLIVVTGSVSLEDGAVVTGDVWVPNSSVSDDGSVTIAGNINRDLGDFAAAWWFFGFVFAIGAAIATILSALVFAAFAAKAANDASTAIRTNLGDVALAGVVLWIALPAAAILLLFTVVGTPSSLFLLFLVLPAFAFVGYLVSGIFLGKLLVDRDDDKTHPYMAAFVGTLALMLINLVPILGGLVNSLAALLGASALALLAWRAFRSGVDDEVAPAAEPA